MKNQSRFYIISAIFLYLFFLVGSTHRSYDIDLISEYVGYVPYFQWILVKSINFTISVILVILFIFLLKKIFLKKFINYGLFKLICVLYFVFTFFNLIMWIFVDTWPNFPVRNIWILALFLLPRKYLFLNNNEDRLVNEMVNFKVIFNLFLVSHILFSIITVYLL